MLYEVRFVGRKREGLVTELLKREVRKHARKQNIFVVSRGKHLFACGSRPGLERGRKIRKTRITLTSNLGYPKSFQRRRSGPDTFDLKLCQSKREQKHVCFRKVKHPTMSLFLYLLISGALPSLACQGQSTAEAGRL